MIIENYFFLLAGMMALFFSVGHALWGRRSVLREVRSSEIPLFTKHMLLVIWDQPTVFHFLSAVALIMASLSTQQALMNPLALFIMAVSFGFFLNYVGRSLLENRAALAQIIPQTIALVVYFGIIFAGIHTVG
ncbi:MAG: hypothetical protein ABI690_03600 [Chloroflexota bacterium]